MMLLRRWRFFYRVGLELYHKYTKSLVVGFFLGVIGSVSILRIAPYVYERFFYPTQRTGIIGEFTPSTLPTLVQKLISDGLTTLAADGQPTPGLATSWEASDSGKRYIFHLSSDFKWRSGKKVTAFDINYNIRDVSLMPLDEHTLQVNLKEAYSPFPTLVAKPVIQAGLEGFGLYKVESIRLKGEIVDYLKLLPIKGDLPGKEYRFYKTENDAITAYKLGDIDIITQLSDLRDLRNWTNTDIVTTIQYDRIVAVFFNVNNKLLADKGLRQALGFGVPNLSEVVAYSPISAKSWAYSDSVKKYAYDKDAASRLFKKNLPASDSASLTISTFAPYVSVAQKIADSWTALGLPTKIKIENSISPDFQVLLSAQVLPPDPDQYPFWHSTQKSTNVTGFANVKIDKLLEDGRRELDINKRKKIYADFTKYLTDEAPVIFLYYPKTYTVKRIK